MAMNMRPRGAGVPGTRQRAIVRSMYDDIKPMPKWVNEPGADIVHFQLPGFVKEQIRILAETTTRVLRVRGERFVAGNKWIRFNEVVQIPVYCSINEIRAKFEDRTLKISMPKETPTQPPPAEQPKVTQPPQPPAHPQPVHQAQPRPQPVSQAQPHPSPQKARPDPPNQKPQEDSPPKAKPLSAFEKPKNETRTQRKNPLFSQDIPRYEQNLKQNLAQKGSVPPKAAFESEERSDHRKKAPSSSSLPTEGEHGRDSQIRDQEQETYNQKLKKSVEAEEAMNKNKNKENHDDAGEEQGHATSTEGKEKSKVEDYMKAMKGLSRNLNEDRQMLTNMGVAALVIVAIGSYITYTIGGS